MQPAPPSTPALPMTQPAVIVSVRGRRCELIGLFPSKHLVLVRFEDRREEDVPASEVLFPAEYLSWCVRHGVEP